MGIPQKAPAWIAPEEYLALVVAGKGEPLAVTSDKRVKLPEVPSASEVGLPSFAILSSERPQ